MFHVSSVFLILSILQTLHFALSISNDANNLNTLDGNGGDGDLGDILGSLFDNLGDAGTGKGIKSKKNKRNKQGQCTSGKHLAPVQLNTLLNAKPRRHFTANGCGPQGMEVQEPFGLWKCCNGHDVCYSTPGATFNYCEKTFHTCMKKLCKEYHKGGKRKQCQEQADGFSGMTKIFGRGAHSSSQRDVVECLDSKTAAKDRWHTFIKDIYIASKIDAMPSDASISNMLARMKKGKEGEFIDRLVKKYGKIWVKKTGSVEIDFYLTKQEINAVDKITSNSDRDNIDGGSDTGSDL
jgi:secretory phospholipase A2